MKLIISTLAAALALSTISTAFAGPKHPVAPTKQTVVAPQQKIPEPTYFKLATSEL